MNRLFCLSGLLILCSCSSVPRSAPRFSQPSTAPIKKAIAVTQQKQASVGEKIQKAQKTVTIIQNDCPGAKAEIDSLSNDLMEAYADNKEAELSLQAAEGMRDQLDTQLKDQTTLYNQLADDYDKSAVQITALKESRHGWVKRFWIATIIAVGAIALIVKPWRFFL